MAFFEDSEYDPLRVEEQLLKTQGLTHVDRLRQQLLRSQITENVPHARVRMITVLANKAEPGSVFFGLVRPRFLDVEFRSKRNMLDIDTDLTPYYGNVKPALLELKSAGMDTTVTDFWLDMFRKDNAIYRVYVVNAMCFAAALRALA